MTNQIDENVENAPECINGICPYMTSTQGMPAPQPANIVNVSKPEGFAIAQIINFVPCLGSKCQIWDQTHKRCGLVSMPVLRDTLFTIAQDKDITRAD